MISLLPLSFREIHLSPLILRAVDFVVADSKERFLAEELNLRQIPASYRDGDRLTARCTPCHTPPIPLSAVHFSFLKLLKAARLIPSFKLILRFLRYGDLHQTTQHNVSV